MFEKLSPVERRSRASQINLLTDIVVVSNVVLKRVDCIFEKARKSQNTTSFYSENRTVRIRELSEMMSAL